MRTSGWMLGLIGLVGLGCGERGSGPAGSAGAGGTGGAEGTAAPVAGIPCEGVWERFLEAPYTEIALPDTHVTYWRYRFEMPLPARVALEVHGQYARARYVNFNAYDQDTIDPSDSLPDRAIAPDPGSENPFSGPASGKPGRYTVRVAPPATALARGPGNVLKLPLPPGGVDVQRAELWYRVYAPDPGLDRNGGVPLPEVRALDAETGQPIACPVRRSTRPPLVAALGNYPPRGQDGAIRSYASKGRALYGNLDNQYVAARLDFNAGEVAVVRVRPPRWPSGPAAAGKAFGADAEVRYWSLCIGGASTQTSACLADYEASASADGFVALVIGPDALEAEVRAAGLNFLPRGHLLAPILVYRNLLSRDFEGSLLGVPAWPPARGDTRGPDELAADRFVGDRSPTGRHCSLESFRRDRCGIAAAPGVAPPAIAPPVEPPAGASAAPSADTAELRVAVPWTFLLGNLLLRRMDPLEDPDPTAGELRVAELLLERLLSEATGKVVAVEALAPDLAAERVLSGEADFAILPAPDHVWIRDAWPVEPIAVVLESADAPALGARVIVRAADPTADVAALRGKALGVGTARYESLWALEGWLAAAGLAPERAFAVPGALRREVDLALDDVASGAADAALCDEAAWARYQAVHADRAALLRTLVSAPVPPAVVVRAPAGRPAMPAEAFAAALVAVRDGTPAGDASGAAARFWSIGRFRAFSPADAAALDALAAQLRGREFSLPVFFFR